MIYNIKDNIPFKKFIFLSIQMVLAVFVATALIANICGVNMSAALIGAGLSTITYLVCTNFNSPMFISNSGAFVAPVLFAMSVGGYSGIAIGGLISCIVYTLFAFLFKYISVNNLYKIFPKTLIGAVTVCIGINLMAFIPTYIGDTGYNGLIVAFITMLTIALSSHYLKGVLSMFPFLIGIIVGYIVSIIFGLVDFSVFNNIGFICMPEFAFTKFTNISIAALISIVIIYTAFTVSAMMECLSDHAALSNIIDVDLYRTPGLSKIFIGEGFANLINSCVGGLGSCSYGEGVATVGFSKCASTKVTFGAAIILILLGFLAPVQAFIASIPSCCFGGAACILYGFIANSGIKQLQHVDLNNQKNLIIVSTVLSLGICGLVIGNGTISISGTALALVAGVILNTILKNKKFHKTILDREPNYNIIEDEDKQLFVEFK